MDADLRAMMDADLRSVWPVERTAEDQARDLALLAALGVLGGA